MFASCHNHSLNPNKMSIYGCRGDGMMQAVENHQYEHENVINQTITFKR